MLKKTGGGTTDKVAKLDLGGQDSSRRTLENGQFSARTANNFACDMNEPEPEFGFLIANGMVDYIVEKVDESITVIETLKKIPEFNANLSVEYALQCAQMRTLSTDPRLDDIYLVRDDEPVSEHFFHL